MFDRVDSLFKLQRIMGRHADPQRIDPCLFIIRIAFFQYGSSIHGLIDFLEGQAVLDFYIERLLVPAIAG